MTSYNADATPSRYFCDKSGASRVHPDVEAKIAKMGPR